MCAKFRRSSSARTRSSGTQIGVSGPRLNAIDRAAEVPVERLELLRGNAIFAPLPAPTLEQLADALEEVRPTAGEEIVRQGAPGDRFYLVKEGTLEVHVDGRRVQVLGPGESFGEIALLRDIPRTATVRARTEAKLWALERGEFLDAVSGHARSQASAEEVAVARLGTATA